MSIGQIEFNGVKSFDDLGMYISGLSIGNPKPNLIFESVPYMQGVYDFSSINGETTYSTREIKIQLKLEKYIQDTLNINTVYNIVINKFSTNEFKKLKIDYQIGYYKARLSEVTDIDLFEEERTLELTFICQPFRIYDYAEGEFIWDTFCFETDIIQNTIINVDSEEKITLTNLSVVSASPTIICNSDMSIDYKNKSYQLYLGENRNVIKLEKGNNEITINGNGQIEFRWYREVI